MELVPIKHHVWRAVEAQHRVSTLRLVDSDPADHDVLEDLLESSKPEMPKEARNLHYLLSTPFRYPSPHGSRFRDPFDPGVFYAALEIRSACAELGYWRWRFVADSQGLMELKATAHTVFECGISAKGIDLSRSPWRRNRRLWMDKEDYSSTQALASKARHGAAEVILYESVRDPEHGLCAAVLSPRAFRPPRPLNQQTWFLTITRSAALWTRERTEFAFRYA